MKAITYHGRRDIRLEELSPPELGSNDVYINIKDTLLSQSIIDFYMEGHLVDLSQPHPVTQIGNGYVMGQQFGGIIEKVGKNVDPNRVGKYVAVAPGVGCKACDHCQKGYQNYCEKYYYYGMIGAHGGLAEASVVKNENAIEVPSNHWGLMLECMLVVKSLLRKSQPWIDAGEPILILGAGPIGISAAILLDKLYGADYRLYDIMPLRLERARNSGYKTASLEAIQQKYHLVLDCAGTNPETGGSALLDGLKCVDKGGALMFVGTYLHATNFMPLQLLVNEVTIGGSYAYTDQDLVSLSDATNNLDLKLEGLIESISLAQILDEGLLRGEAERDSFTILAVTQ